MTEAIPGPAYRIKSERLILRCWEPADAPLLEVAVDESLDHLLPWMPWAKHEPSDFQTRIDTLRRFRGNFDLGKDFIYGIFDAEESQVLGGTGLHTRVQDAAPEFPAREIGYWIHKDHVNRGLATEATAALTRVAFEVDRVDRVEIRCEPQNVRSAAIPRKLGFQHEATLARRLRNTYGEPRETSIWSLFADDYSNTPSAGAQIEAYDVVGRQII
ncbi:MAG TPA: GNAT family protein [Anaerolineae bacterium]|jgi:RimJ/RimL family protein N-acetyltransferase|nr:GNAT family protein [Anaerolineae bacterium]